jgi:hypothetical protein
MNKETETETETEKQRREKWGQNCAAQDTQEMLSVKQSISEYIHIYTCIQMYVPSRVLTIFKYEK